MSSSLRRPLLVLGIGLVTAATTKRAHALRDPSSLEVGGSYGEHDGHVACGPDVRVRNASAGVHYEHMIQDPDSRPGKGFVMDVRAGLGTTQILKVQDNSGGAACDNVTGDPTCAALLRTAEDSNSTPRAHVLGGVQATFGWDWRVFQLTGGVGVFGTSRLNSDNTRFDQHFLPLPVLDMRIGKREGISAQLGFGAPPVAGLSRWAALYGILQYKHADGGDVGVGLLAIPVDDLDNRGGILVKGSFPIARGVSLGGFGLVGQGASEFGGVNYDVGANLTFVFDEVE